MNRTLADPKLFGGCAHRRPILDYVKGQLTGPFLNIAFQPATLPYASSRFDVYAGKRAVMKVLRNEKARIIIPQKKSGTNK